MNETEQGYYKISPFSYASMIAGILALVTICTGILPIVFGSLSIIFAVLSRRKRRPFDTYAYAGICTSIVGYIFALAAILFTIGSLSDPAQRAYMNQVSQQMYGYTFDELMMDAYGIDMDKYFPLHTQGGDGQ